MKRSPLKRGKPLARGAGLKTHKPLERRTQLKPRSKKMTALYTRRRDLVAALLEDGVCERCKTARATDVHEPLLRSRGGDIVDPDQCVALCRSCHDWIHDHPKAATVEGWMKHAWDRVGDADA